MLLFTVKKAFFDMWDNFLAVVIMNLGFIALLAIPVLVPPAVVEIHILLALGTTIGGGLLVVVYCGALAMAARDIANYERPEFRKFPHYLKETWASSLVLGLIWTAVALVVNVGFPVYLGMGNLVGLAAAVFLFWAILVWALAGQFYFPIRAQLDDKITKVLRKCFVIFFDNTVFAIVVGIGTIVVSAGSAFTAFLIPGIGGLLIWHQVALKLRLYKYDYLEEHPDANRKDIPWDALLIDEKDRVGKRTLRGMIFPWKE